MFNIVNIKAAWVPRDGCPLCSSTVKLMSPHAANNSVTSHHSPLRLLLKQNSTQQQQQHHQLLPQLMDRHNQQEHKLQCLQLQIRLSEYRKTHLVSLNYNPHATIRLLSNNGWQRNCEILTLEPPTIA
jgi:hypothetical protein